MMLLLVVLTGILAVQQNAKSLALFGIVGGFLAPILMSTGSGSHNHTIFILCFIECWNLWDCMV